MPWILSVTVTLLAPLVLISYYVGRKLLKASTLRFSWDHKRTKWSIIAAYGYLHLLPILFALSFFVGGRGVTLAFTGENRWVDFFIVYPFWVTLVVNIQAALLFSPTDLSKLVFRKFYKQSRDRWRDVESKTVLATFGFILAYTVITIVFNTWTVRLSEKSIALPPQFSGLDGLRIAQISDVQGDGRTSEEDLRDYVKRVNDLHPDLILFGGDIVTSGEKYIESTAAILGELRAKYGIFAAVGDHDIFSNRTRVVYALTSNGIQVIEDSSIVLQTEKGPIEITGITYTYRQRPDEASLAKAMNGNSGAYKILLCHQPAEPLVKVASQKGYNLYVAGHTHGGGLAFGIPGLFLVAPASFESRYVSGLYHNDNLQVSVTNGLGLTLAPIRFNAPAEITLLTLVKK
ncbi:MAG: Metallophos domain-containing protein [Bacteroidetes bacterium]|nr:Metallophos domain-containing protein [Bacteroidota bacterium]